jgi:hypothetical protein
MKTMKIFFAFIALALASLGMRRQESSVEKFANGVISSLKTESPENFETIFPTLSEFYQVMEGHESLYAGSLETAKREFADEYNHKIAPSMLASYKSVRAEAAQVGIDWNSASVLRVFVEEGVDQDVRPMTIYFSSGGKDHRLVIGKAMKLGGKWKATGDIRLIPSWY